MELKKGDKEEESSEEIYEDPDDVFDGLTSTKPE